MNRTEWLLAVLVFLVACQISVSVVEIRGGPGTYTAVQPFGAISLLVVLGVPLYVVVHVLSGYVTTASDIRDERSESE